MRIFLITLVLISVFSISGITLEDLNFCLDREIWTEIENSEEEIIGMLGEIKTHDTAYKALYKYYGMIGDDSKQLDVMFQDIKFNKDLYTAIRYTAYVLSDSLRKKQYISNVNYFIDELFTQKDEQEVFDLYLKPTDRIAQEKELIRKYGDKNSVLNGFIKTLIDEMIIERDSSTLLEQANSLDAFLPSCSWSGTLLYLKSYALLDTKNYEELYNLLNDTSNRKTLMEKYVVARKSLDETMRDSLRLSDKDDLALISTTLSLSNEILYELKDDGTKYKLMNLEWDYNYFKSKVNILKSQYLAELYDLTKDTSTLDSAMECLNSCSFPNNNDGELAGVEYRKGKILIKYDSPEKDRDAGIAFSNSLIYGAPRKGYDIDATEALNKLLVKNNIPLSPIEASRASHLYKGPTFDNETEQAGFKDSKLTRIAVGDYNNDGWDDLLLGGLEIYKNNQNSTFTPVTKELVKEINSASGGLWADINKDGNLDFIKLSADVNGHGDRLFLADGEGRFLKSDNNIDDFANTEGAGIIDIDMDGYPELYSANYENWSAKTYYEDKFWKNTKGHLSDKSAEYGFVNSYNDSLKSQAGRGVAPADYDNDGIQELLVTNYRLTRNFLYDMNNNKATDKAGLELIAGKDVEGWFGHSIGADWGDFDNDGDLDLFIANLAHPRYIEFSDISMLLRNDGEKIKKIGENEYRYTQFTDITSTSGITFDELHSDPSWFDADNDGDLDLFITSIYTNDRSYLYLNNGDYTFTDITWLSGCRMYNGWGNATADFNRDGKLDLIVGSGNGVKLFMNSTVNNNQSASYKLYWKNNKIKYIKSSKWKDSLPNSPAFGARLRLTTIDKNKNIKTQIRELRGSKGTTSQSSQTLHFGLGETKLKKVEIIKY